MNKINLNMKTILMTLLSAMIVLSSCEDYLEQDPKDELTEAIYFTKPEHFEYASYNLYGALGWDDGDEASDLCSNLADDDVAHGYSVAALDDDDYWKKPYSRLRAVNELIQKAEEYTGDKDEIAEYLGVGYFFRAWNHFIMLKRYGGVPIVTRVLDVDSEEVYGPRNSRYEVVYQILTDLDMAIERLRFESDINDGTETGMVSVEAAKAFKARVLLYEATWEKYVSDIEYLDGDGIEAGAGSNKPEGYPSITDMLTDAKQAALDVMSSGEFELWDKRAQLEAAGAGYGDRHIYYMFTLEDGSNPAGLSKSDNKEFVFQTVYDYTYKQIRQNLSHSMKFTPSRKLMDMYLCKDGLPVQYSSEFKGYRNMTDEFENRDLRLVGLVSEPGKQYWGYGASARGGGARYDKTFEEVELETSYDYTYWPQLLNNAERGVGYSGLKFVTENYNRETNTESYNYPQIRLAEVMLIYAEAACELGGGQLNVSGATPISQGDLDMTINKIRARAGVAPLTYDLIAPYPELTMLGEIRRERAIELYGEGHRYDDLKRWGIAYDELRRSTCLNYIQYEGTSTEYETMVHPQYEDGRMLFDASVFPNGLTSGESATSSYAGIAPTKPGALIIDDASVRSFRVANYLEPIPKNQIELNPALVQNPGW
ncbi:RagB/SusD family nutrient uptake outer membrane protein [Saccharicrinis fermentans]|nr:RagB/SusD family nutrient uptake outer membrane protein [Saccharicrinis fermentans]